MIHLTQIVRETPEPRKTAMLRNLVDAGEAVTLEYVPRSGCPSIRRDSYTVLYGTPEKRVVFHARKPKAVSIGLAAYILGQMREHPGGGETALRWRDDEWREVSEGYNVAALPDVDISQRKEADEARQRAASSRTGDGEPAFDLGAEGRRPAREEDVRDPAETQAPRAPKARTDASETDGTADVGEAQKPKYLSNMNRAELAEVFTRETGQEVPSGTNARELYVLARDAVKAAKSSGGGTPETTPA